MFYIFKSKSVTDMLWDTLQEQLMKSCFECLQLLCLLFKLYFFSMSLKELVIYKQSKN